MSADPSRNRDADLVPEVDAALGGEVEELAGAGASRR